MSVQVRAATPADIEALAAIEAESFTSPWPGNDFLRELDNSWVRLWVCEVQAEIAGYMLAWFLEPTVELHKIAVSGRFRRHGLAAGMMAQLIAAARNAAAETVWLEVRASNDAAVRLYERFGFKLANRRRDYYENPREDALCFRLELSGGRE